MIKTKHLLLILLPAILIVTFAIFIRVVQYQPLFEKVTDATNLKTTNIIPIFPEDPIIGNKKAGQTIIIFEDFGCESCKTQNLLLNDLITKYPEKIKVIWKGLPVSKFPYDTREALKHAYCANLQNKFIEFADLAFNNNDRLSPEILNLIDSEILDSQKLKDCLSTTDAENYIDTNEQLAQLLNIQAVPTIFINNQQITLPASLESWESTLTL